METPSVPQRGHWDRIYQEREDFFGAEPSDFGLRAAQVFGEAHAHAVLELGCGQGRDTLLFLQRGFAVTALDYSKSAIQQLARRAETLGLAGQLRSRTHDMRQPLPFRDGAFDACYSHMLFTMELTEEELRQAFGEVLRVLRPDGLNVYSVRNDHDPHFGKGTHRGEDMWQNPMGFVVHFFTEEKVRRLAKGYELLRVGEFEDPSPPFTKKLYEVVLRKPK